MNRITYVTRDPGRFDVVVFKREDGKKNVKRIIGLPGETVQIKDGLVYINGEALKEDKMGKYPWQEERQNRCVWEKRNIFF